VSQHVSADVPSKSTR